MDRTGTCCGAALALALALAAGGCKMTPDEIRAVQTENELLREQIQGLKDRCDTQGRVLDVRPEREIPASR